MNRRKRKEIAINAGVGSKNIGTTLPPIMKPLVKENKIGRNDPCPCSSGKKYKQCHLKLENYEQYY